MKNVMIFALLASMSVGVVAGHHKDGQGHHKKGHHGKGPERVFEKADSDGDGRISSEEHERAIEKMAEKRRAHFAKMDADDDGFVTQEEARVAFRKLPKRHAEMEARMQHHQAE